MVVSFSIYLFPSHLFESHLFEFYPIGVLLLLTLAWILQGVLAVSMWILGEWIPYFFPFSLFVQLSLVRQNWCLIVFVMTGNFGASSVEYFKVGDERCEGEMNDMIDVGFLFFFFL